MTVLAPAEAASSVSLQAGVDLNFNTFLAAACCLLAAAISSAGGLGGGSLYVPILTLVAGVPHKQATAFSSFMVAGSSAAHVLCTVLRRRNGQPGIDYGIAVLSEPCLLLGVSVGVMCNVVLPEWLVTLMFAVVVAFSAVKTCQTGVRRWKAESEEARAMVQSVENGVMEEPLLKAIVVEEELQSAWSRITVKKVLVLALVWVSFLVVQVARSDRKGKILIEIRPCSPLYWAVTATQVPLAVLFIAFAFYEKKQTEEQQQAICSHGGHTTGGVSAEQVKQRNVSGVFFLLAALLAGILGGLFGIGGGLLINPALLQMGIHPLVITATCSFMMLFSSTMSSAQYLLNGTVRIGSLQVPLVLAAGCAAASATGVLVLHQCVRKHGRTSLVVFLVATVMMLSTASMTALGALDVWREYKDGGEIGQLDFKPLC